MARRNFERLIDPEANPGPARDAIKSLRDSKPWRGTWDERLTKLQDFARAYYAARAADNIVDAPWQIVHVGDQDDAIDSGGSRLRPRLKRIELRGRLSVITTLYLVGLSTYRKSDRTPRVGLLCLRWAVTMFGHFFPRSARRLEFRGGLVRKVTQTQE